MSKKSLILEYWKSIDFYTQYAIIEESSVNKYPTS